jgi:two-component system, chemotaxis family, chemotaxis protein CheY
MIQERRVIVFPRADFLDAMRHYGERVGKPMPDSPPQALSFDPAQDVALTVTFPAARGGVETRFAFSREDVGQALTNYCRDHKVPLPKDVAKQVEKFKDGAALTLQLGKPGLHIMIIDDQEVMRNIIKKLLVKANPAQISEASNGIEALEMLRSGDVDPDVILCDLHMEKMDGSHFLRELRADKTNRSRRKPVLILTGDKNEQAHEVTRQLGASKVLTKPIPPDELIRQIMLVQGYFEAAK